MIPPAFRRALASLCAASCFALGAPAQGASLMIDIPDCATPSVTYNGGVLTISGCSSGGGGTTGAPSGCSINASPASLPAGGGAVSLTMTCVSGSPTSYTWSGGGVAGTGQAVSANILATTTFTATASNAAGSSSPASRTVTVGTSSASGGGAIRCDGFNATHVLDFKWTGFSGNQRLTASGAGANDAVVARFTTGPGTAPGAAGSISAGEYAGVPAQRLTVLSDRPCDFGPGLAKYALKTGQTTNTRFYVGGGPLGYPILAPNTTYYLNIKTTSGCSDSTSCQMAVELSKPAGLP